MSDLSEYFEEHKFKLTHLDLSSNLITVDGVFKFFTALKNNQTLKRLNLSRNDLSFANPGPFYHVMESFITSNRSLEELDLNNCKLGLEGAGILGKGLRKNQKLQKLHLSNNSLLDKGLSLILEGLLENSMTSGNVMLGSVSISPITEIDFSKNGIELLDSKVISKLCKLMTETQTKLGSINLRDNLIRDEAADLISIALKQNLTIVKFLIDMNPVKHSIVKEMEQSVKRNITMLKDKEWPAIK